MLPDLLLISAHCVFTNGKGSSILETSVYRVPELIPVLGSQPAGDRSHKPGGRLPLLSTRPTVTSPAAEHASPPLGRYQVILLGDRGTYV